VHGARQALTLDEAVEQTALPRLGEILRRLFGQMRNDDDDALVGRGELDARWAAVEHGLLDEVDAVIARGAAEQMLRTLEDEVPAEMRKAEDIVRWRQRHGATTPGFGARRAVPLA
jgi:hypothetical protein